jgi:hypothetical protein
MAVSGTRGAGERPAGARELGDAEIAEVGLAVAVEEDVGRLEIAVDDALGVGGVQRLADAGQDLGRFGRGQGAGADAPHQRSAAHVAHHQERLAVLLAEIVDRDDRRVLERGDGAGLALEAGAERGIVEQFARQDLDRHFAVEVRVVAEVDGGHAAASDLVAGDFFGDRLRFRIFGHAMLSLAFLLRPPPPSPGPECGEGEGAGGEGGQASQL